MSLDRDQSPSREIGDAHHARLEAIEHDTHLSRVILSDMLNILQAA